MALKIVAIPGSLRAGSFNRKLLALAIQELKKLDVETDLVDLKTLNIPIYDGDDEEKTGLPAPVQELRAKIAAAQGIVIASPEYNWSVPGGLKNAIDWVSRPPNQPVKGKVALLMGASTGAFATVRMQPILRQSLITLGAFVYPTGFMLPAAQAMLDEQGNIKDAKRAKELETLVADFVAELKRHAT